MKLYKMIVNENQLRILHEALESYTRLGIGQLETVLSDLGFSKIEQFKNNIQNFHSSEVETAIHTIKDELFDLTDKASYGIRNDKVNEDFKVSYDLYTAIKNKITQLNNDSRIIITSDDPYRISKNGIIQIELCTKEEERLYAETKES